MTNKILFISFIIILGIVLVSPIAYAQTGSVQATVKVSVCGNDLVEADEECDNSDFNNQSCSSFGFNTGDLSCNADCTVDTSDCSGNNGGGGGGGGGGGTSIPIDTTIIFIGHSYPNSQVIILKDGQIASSILSSSNANFEATLTGLSAGNYTFSVYSQDKAGNKSSNLTFSIDLTAGAITKISGIFVSPTIEVDKSSVRQGDNLTIFGYSFPQSQITLSINSPQQFFVTTQADDTGYYIYNLDSSLLSYGQHTIKARATHSGEGSDFSQQINFTVDSKSIYSKETQSSKSDLNSDNRVNLVDFSILAYWYKRPNPPTESDLNGDNKIDLIDFSIMAYHWSG